MRRVITILMIVLLSTIVAQGQIKIGGNVYGGGNKGNVEGSTKVTVKAGDINKVFGGARMANIGGNAYVNIDGKNALDYMVINYVYGGNDVAGTIGTAAAVGEELPAELTNNPDGVDNTWNSYVHLSTKVDGEGHPAGDAKKCFIGQMFAGGNGDFNYTDDEGNPLMDGDNYIVTEDKKVNGITQTITVASSPTPLKLPELDKTYLDIQGGTIFFAHGGGNNVTVKEKAVIHVDNPSEVVTDIKLDENGLEDDENGTDILTANNSYRIKEDMGVRLALEHVESDEFQIGRLFGGNNKAEMHIRPTWNLQSGKIRNLYSGGNRGKMTSPEGLLLEINPLAENTNPLVIDNIYGGCRMADVMPTVNGNYSPCTNQGQRWKPDL